MARLSKRTEDVAIKAKTGPSLKKMCDSCKRPRITDIKPVGCKPCYESWYRLRNRKKLNDYHISYREINGDRLREQERNRYKDNPQTRNERSKLWAKKNIKKISKKNILKNKYSIQHRIKHNIKQQFFYHLKKSMGFCKLVGCTMDELKAHIESKFQPGMSWSNYGLYGWHIDHIRPISSFDLAIESNIYEAWHYSNLQPLWATDNLKKSNRYET